MKAIVDITRDCLDLPSTQRLKLARILLDVSEPDQDFSPHVEEAWETEIAARMTAVIEGTVNARPVAEVFSKLDERFPT